MKIRKINTVNAIGTNGITGMAIPIKFNKKNGVRHVEHYGASYCREVLVNNFERCIEQKTVKLDKARITFIGLSRRFHDEEIILKVLKTINTIEEAIGIEKSTATIIVYSKNPPADRLNMLMFSGPIKWYRSSHTMSLYLLILRLAIKGVDYINNTDYNSIVESIKQHIIEYTNIKILTDEKYFIEAEFMILPLMRNLDDIFSVKRKWANRFDRMIVHTKVGKYRRLIGTEGIHCLSTGDSQHKDVEKLALVLKREGIDYQFKEMV